MTENISMEVNPNKATENGVEKLNFGLKDVCVTSSIWLPKYGKEGESDTIRGNLTIEAVSKAIKAGCKYSLAYNEGTSEEFLEALKTKIIETISEKDEGGLSGISNVFILTKSPEDNYSPTRQYAFEMGRKNFGSPVIVTQEAEKNLTSTYTDFLKAINNGAHVVLLDRGIAKAYERPKNPNLPPDQYTYERLQDLIIHGKEEDAGFLQNGAEPFDRLIGFRMLLNKEIAIKSGEEINPVDLFSKLKTKYDDGFDEKKTWGENFSTDRYAQAVYFGITVAESLGLKITSVEVPYYHDSRQTEIETGPDRELWLKKRIKTAKTLLPQMFDMLASILEYQKQGLWPQVLIDSIKNGSPLGIQHFDMGKYTIKDGKVVERLNQASWVQA